MTPITVGLIPVLDAAPMHLGMQEGFFEDEGLDVTIETGQGGAAMVPAVLAQDYDFAFGNNLSLLVGEVAGLDLRIATAGSDGGTEGTDLKDAYHVVLVPNNSPIKSAADLEGHTVATNALGNIGQVGIRAAVDAAGGDSSRVEFIEVGFPDMPSVLLNGEIDAAWVVEPFATIVADEMRPVAAISTPIANNLSWASYFTSASFAESNPETIEAFQRAMTRSLEFARDNPDAVRAVFPTYLEVPEELAANVTLPPWSPDINVESLEELSEIAQRYGALKDEPDLDTLILDD